MSKRNDVGATCVIQDKGTMKIMTVENASIVIDLRFNDVDIKKGNEKLTITLMKKEDVSDER